MRPCFFPLLSLAVIVLSSVDLAQDDPPAVETPPARPRRAFSFTAARRVVGAADTDSDWRVDAGEWQRFLNGFDTNGSIAGGAIDPLDVALHVVTPMVDQDGDRRVSLDDLFMIFERADKNLDFKISPDELEPPRSRTSTGRRNRNAFMAVLPLHAADRDGDKEVSADEWGDFIDALESDDEDSADIISAEDRKNWIQTVRHPVALTSSDFGLLGTPAGFLRWLGDGLDADEDGVITLADLEVFFAELDVDADGVVRENELDWASARRRRRGRNRDRDNRDPLMAWQRSLEDALVLVKTTGKPLLICVNMDGEMASESFALTRYRDPEFVRLTEGFIPLLVSPDRRNRRDYDDRGRRIIDRKFGRLVNGEHIDIESELYERYFDGRRVAPRHLAVDADGKVLFDLFLINDLTLVNAALSEHGVEGAGARAPSTLSEAELLASPDALHRESLERRFLEGNERTRTRLTSLALSNARAAQHPEILRLALHDPVADVRLKAAWSIIQHPERAPLDFFSDAFRACVGHPIAPSALVEALAHIARSSTSEMTVSRARRLHRAFAGLSQPSDFVQVDRWQVALSWSAPTALPLDESKEALTARLERLEERLAVDDTDPELNLAFAATNMRFAQALIREGGNPSLMLEDVLTAAKRAAESEESGRSLAYVAWASYLLGDLETAAEHAAAALPNLVSWAGSPLAAKTLEILATVRMRATYTAIGKNIDWPATWVSDVRAAQEVLLVHPHGNETHATDYLAYLNAIDVAHPQESFLNAALERFPLSGELHANLRIQLLRIGGAAALERAYANYEVKEELASTFVWYEGLALLMAAERHIQNQEEGPGLEAYLSSVKHFRASAAAESEFEDSASHYVCLALAGIARVHTDSERWEQAIAALEEGISANSRSIWRMDGLGNAPRDTARLLHRSLVDAGLEKEADELETFLSAQGVPL